MDAHLSAAVILFCGVLIPVVTAGEDCKSYINTDKRFVSKKDCSDNQYCCGSCEYSYCCSSYFLELNQDQCEYRNKKMTFYNSDTLTISFSVVGVIIALIIFICCCVCPCCCCYNMCRKPRPVVTTTTHTTVVNTQFPQQPVQSYQGGPQYPSYQPLPSHQAYCAQPQAGYPSGPPMPTAAGPPMPTTAGYQAPPFQPGPPPPYQEAGPGYPPAIPVPYSHAAFSPGQPSYPLQPPFQAQAGAPPVQPDFLGSQPAYNPAFVASQPPKSGY
ncbi:hypothetical protein DPEC_G00249380 [Dallia pectoralis]|uniref:Uncharacterized protein n=1 Tax=Dallia pectoralis TaxID=75939 RepID=A0ACC2FSP8_DALPE|nr:hypothetical protein DPEC_G00249380 [Dallia pectoralis]